MNRKILLVLLALALMVLILTPEQVLADPLSPVVEQESLSQQTVQELPIYFFYGDTCPHCAKAKPVMRELAAANPEIQLYEIEIYNSEQNRQLFSEIGKLYEFEPQYVPTIIIGLEVWQGYSEEFAPEITNMVNRCLTEVCENRGQALIEASGIKPYSPTTGGEQQPTSEPTSVPEEEDNANLTKLPIFGKVDFSNMGLFLSTALIAFVDGFNPCSLWVLSMLLAITLRTGSRKKIIVIGLVFLTVTALVYALFIAGLFTVLKVLSFVGWVQVVVALVALLFGLINIKDYFFYKEGVSMTISDQQKPGIYQRMRKILEAGDSWWGLVGGTILLALGVSLVEFSCTAGFPVLWTNLVSAHDVTTITFILLLLLYMIIYQLDELAIFMVATVSLKSQRMEEKHGRILKLIGGVLMLTLAIVMLVNPALMSDIGKSLLIFAIAFGITILILLIHRIILPRLGIHIGTEFKKNSKKHSRHDTHHH